AQKSAQMLRHRRERIVGLKLPFGRPPEVRGDHDRRAFVERVLYAGQRGANARVVADAAVLYRDVEIRANEDPLAAQVHVGHALELHYFTWASSAPTVANAAVTSSMRLEKPHSLSYHEETFTSVPSETRVSVESKIELAGLWLKSDDTSSSVLYSRMPLRSPSHACFTARFTSSTVVGFLATKVRSTMETLIVGTRIE